MTKYSSGFIRHTFHMNQGGNRRIFIVAGAILLLAIMAAELVLSAQHQSQTFDEACHIFAGYRYWKNFDFGINPEHPPLVKLVAAIPLLCLPLRVPVFSNGHFKEVEFVRGEEFLYGNNADTILWRSRMAAAVFTIGLGLAVFFVANSMWGGGAALVALGLFLFEPNFLAHGALVTTDVAASLGLFLGVGAFYWYLRKPSGVRLAGAGLAAGLCLGAKHSGVLLFPILLFMALTELGPFRDATTGKFDAGVLRRALRQAASFTVIAAIAVTVLWSLYGFRYAARPDGLVLSPPLSQFAMRMTPHASAILLQIADWRLLPEGYLYGIADIYRPLPVPTVIFGGYYAAARWFYFPSVFVIKSTLAFLLVCCTVPFAVATTQKRFSRELLFLTVPPGLYFLVAMNSEMNIGIRHLLPVYPFLIVLGGWSVWRIGLRHKALAGAVVVVLAWHAASSLRAFPNYIPYSNELWGGPANTYKFLADSSVDWGQGLRALRQYIDQRHIHECWVAYFASTVVNVSYYGIPCKPLPTGFTDLSHVPTLVVPPHVDAPVFMSVAEISGLYWADTKVDPYLAFQRIRPMGMIAGSFLVYDGELDLSGVSALTHEYAAMRLLKGQNFDGALREAETAVTLAPDRPTAHSTRGAILSAVGRNGEADEENRKAQAMTSEILSSQ